jgi:hypothetical protein
VRHQTVHEVVRSAGELLDLEKLRFRNVLPEKPEIITRFQIQSNRGITVLAQIQIHCLIGRIKLVQLELAHSNINVQRSEVRVLKKQALIHIDRILVVRSHVMNRGERQLILQCPDKLRVRVEQLLLVIQLMRNVEQEARPEIALRPPKRGLSRLGKLLVVKITRRNVKMKDRIIRIDFQ